jgi:hypothetical protein
MVSETRFNADWRLVSGLRFAILLLLTDLGAGFLESQESQA